MKRIRIVGLCLAAVSAIAGVLATSAFAGGTPTWFECAKVAKGSGIYKNKTCTEAAEPGKGKYELKQGAGGGKQIKGKSSGPVALRVKTWLPEQRVECKSAKTESGVALAPNLEKAVKVAYTGCVFAQWKCASLEPAGKPGEIKTKSLTGELGYVKESSPIEVGVIFESEEAPEGPFVKFGCGVKGMPDEVTAAIGGQVIGVQTGDVNTLSKSSTLTDLPGEYYGEHEFDGYKYKPVVNIVGWGSEVEGILKAEESNEEETDPAHVLRGEFCGPFIERVLHVPCTPPAYSGLEQTIGSKGEDLMIKAEA